MKSWKFVGVGVACLVAAQAASAATEIRYPSGPIDPVVPTHADVTDLDGLGIGLDGYLFFNFDAATDSGADPVGENAANNLPSWVGVDFDPNSPGYSFSLDTLTGTEDPSVQANLAHSRGGVSSWASLTLPGGTSGLSGALLDPAAEDNSNNTIPSDTGLGLGADAPPGFWLHIVTDNTNMEADSANRLRAREGVGDVDLRLRDPSFNGVPDVYSFLYLGVQPGDIIALQLNSGVDGELPSIAGVMFDAVPEPASAALLGLGAMGVGLFARRRK